MASYIVEDDQSSKVLHKLFCKIINLLWLKVLAFFQWRYLRLHFADVVQDGVQGTGPFCYVTLTLVKAHKTRPVSWFADLIRLFYLSYPVLLRHTDLSFRSEHERLVMRFTSYLPSFPSCSELDPLHRHEKMRDERDSKTD